MSAKGATLGWKASSVRRWYLAIWVATLAIGIVAGAFVGRLTAASTTTPAPRRQVILPVRSALTSPNGEMKRQMYRAMNRLAVPPSGLG